MSGRAHFVLCEMSLIISTFVHVVPQCLIQHIIGVLILGSKGHPQQGASGRHPYLIMVGYTIYVAVLGYWYLVRLTKMLWAAGLVPSWLILSLSC